MTDGQGYPPVPPMPPGPPGQPGQPGQPAPPQGPPPGGYQQQGGYQQPGGYQEPGHSPYPQYSQYGHYQQYAQNPDQASGPYGGPPEPGRNRKKVIGTWVAVVSAGIVASILVAVLGFKDPTEKKDPAADKSQVPAPVATGKVANPTNTAATGPKKVDITNELKIPATLPPITGPKVTGITVDPKTWPKACDLLTDEEIKSVVPESSVRERKSFMGRYSNMFGTSVNDNECDIMIDLPNLQSYDYPAKINITTYGYKTPAEQKTSFDKEKTQQETSAKSFPTQYDDIPADKIGVDGAFRDNTRIEFYKNGFRVWVTVSGQIEDSQGTPLKGNTITRQYGPSLAAVVGQKL
ncbi:hypothetical protein [Embleya sp. NBC_00896]|uniref:hypothetical protein n=1 Tax=Embleya sp. NBC_00896 TaxID=2975961 RepID=UPI0038663E2F|nr:hypothetical protein OG928_16150 [Embleya sp. NBC_00896]